MRQIWIPYHRKLHIKGTPNFYWNKASLKTVHDPWKKAGVSNISLQPLSDHHNPNHLAALGIFMQI